MKHVKILGLLAVAAAALMAFAGTASADTATSPAGTTYTGKITATAEGHAVLHNPIAKIECASTVSGPITSHGVGKPVGGTIETLDFTACTNEWHVTSVSGGTLSVNNEGATTTVTSSGATVESTRAGITCRYATNNTKVGTLTSGTTATMTISAAIPFHSGSFLCGSGATTWTGSYIVNTPDTLIIDNN